MERSLGGWVDFYVRPSRRYVYDLLVPYRILILGCV